MLVSMPGQVKGEAHHALNSPPRENSLLNSHFLFGSLIKPAADIRIFAFVVLPDDTEIDLPGLPILERTLDAFEVPHRAQVYVLSERATDGDQESP